MIDGLVTPNVEERLHPRPQLVRQHWVSLNGDWRFAFDKEELLKRPADVKKWTHSIKVPFAPETEKSGIHDTGFHNVCWYEREFEAPEFEGTLLLHFGAVDYAAKVWINDVFVGEHVGGYTPFKFDITQAIHLANGRLNKLTVRVSDDPHDLAKPRGKQDWQLEPHGIWYPRTTGIWQEVWLERVPNTYIERLRWTPHLERWEIGFEAFLAGKVEDGFEIKLTIEHQGRVLVNDSYHVINNEIHRRIALSDPGIDDYRNELLWSPEEPTLLNAKIELWRGSEKIDSVHSYTALRSISIQHSDFMLNGRPYYLKLVLDQGYWPETHLTAPSADAFRKDIELTKSMGFNGVRKHQKIEDPRFLYWADTLGLLVWEEMPSTYRFTHESVERLTREWIEVIDRDFNHPCIVVWVPFNESWGVPDLTEKAAHRSCIQALYHLTKTLDSTRPVVGNDGWESAATDIIGIHDYDNHPQRLLERYNTNLSISQILNRRSPAGRLLTVDGYAPTNQPLMLTEFGGLGYSDEIADSSNKEWGYGVCKNLSELKDRFIDLVKTVKSLGSMKGFCYTQLTDTFQEVNGLLYRDRSPKIPIEEISECVSGRAEADQTYEV